MELLSDFRVIITVIAGCIGLYLLFRNKTLVPRSIQVDFGLSSTLRKHLPTRQRARPISLVAIGVPEPRSDEDLYFTIPCLIENNRPHALNKVTLQFEYPIGFEPPSQEEVGKIFKNQIRLLDAAEYSPPHSVQDHLQTRRDFDLVRPGEHLVVGEPMKMRPYNVAVAKNRAVGKHVQTLSQLLGSEEPVLNACPLRLFVFSQELPKSRHDALVIWVSSKDLGELSTNLERIARRLWELSFGGKKWILKYLWERAHKDCLTLLIQPEYIESAEGNARLMDGNIRLDQMSVADTRIPFKRTFGDLFSF